MLKKNCKNHLYNETEILNPRRLFFLVANIEQHQTKYTLKVPNYKTRQKDKFQPPAVFKAIEQKICFYLAIKMYNSVPERIKEIMWKSKFNMNLKNLFYPNHDYTFTIWSIKSVSQLITNSVHYKLLFFIQSLNFTSRFSIFIYF